ncbi:hypothetical protein BH09PSE6_BH09PSE6_30430 [soil metagenome]
MEAPTSLATPPADPPGSERIYLWRVQDVKGRWITTRFRCTEDEIRKQHPEAQRVEYGSMLIDPARLPDGRGSNR